MSKPTDAPVATIITGESESIVVPVTLSLIDHVEQAMGQPLFELIEKWQKRLRDSGIATDIEGETDEAAAARKSAAMFEASKGLAMGEVARFVAASLRVSLDDLHARLGSASLMTAFWALLIAFQHALLQIWGGGKNDDEAAGDDAPKA